MKVLHPHCAGLEVHKESVVACIRPMVEVKADPQVKTFETTPRSRWPGRMGFQPRPDDSGENARIDGQVFAP